MPALVEDRQRRHSTVWQFVAKQFEDSPLQTSIAALSALGAVLYVVLVLLYERFYKHVGIEPEEVGLDRTAILTRALGGVLAIVGAAAALCVVAFIYTVLATPWTRRFALFMAKRTGADERRPAGSSKRFDVGRFWAWYWRMALENHKRLTKRSAILLDLAMLVAFAFVFLVLMALREVEAAGDAAAKGRAVSPLTFAGLRVLDVESTPCELVWIGKASDKPSIVSSPDLHCLGSDGDRWVARAAGHTFRVPASQVVVVTGDPTD